MESGGVGAGTVTRFKLDAGARSPEYRMEVSEPEPGRVLTESDTNSSLVTTFPVSPEGDQSLVQILTTWEGAGGPGPVRAGVGSRLVDPSPIERLLEAVDRLDADGAMALMTPDCRWSTSDGRSVEGVDAARRLLADLLATLRSTAHRVTAQWQEDALWIAEVEATYVLQDWLEIKDRKRAFFVSEGRAGITDVRIYGAHERPLSEHRTGEEGMRVGGRWVPPL